MSVARNVENASDLSKCQLPVMWGTYPTFQIESHLHEGVVCQTKILFKSAMGKAKH